MKYRRVDGRRLQAIEEVGDFLFDLFGGVDGLGDGVAEEVAVAAAEAVGGGFEGAFGHAQGSGHLGEPRAAAGEGGLERLEEGVFSAVAVIGFELGEDLGEQGQGPMALEEAVGGLVGRGGGFAGEAGFGGIEGERGPVAAPFEGVLAGVLVGEEMLEGGEEEGAKTALGGVEVGVGEELLLEEGGEKFLGEVFGGFGGVAVAADVGVEGVPVGAGELFEGVAGGGRVGGVAGGGEDEGPACGEEIGGWHHAAIKTGEAESGQFHQYVTGGGVAPDCWWILFFLISR